MKVVSSEYIISAVGPQQYPEQGYPELAFAGRSNVGKSSLINALVNRKALARTSSTPGKTQTINFYEINQNFHIVDLPGYGFARVAKTQRETWGKMIEGYLTKREELKVVVHLIDIRHAPTRDDVQMYHWLKHFNLPTIIVATKADKISRGNWPKHCKLIKDAIQKRPDDPLIVVSSLNKQGLEELWFYLEQYLTDTPVAQ